MRYAAAHPQLSAQLVTHEARARDISNAGPWTRRFWPYTDTIGGSRRPGTRGGPRAD